MISVITCSIKPDVCKKMLDIGVQNGGGYIVEDMYTSYWKEFVGQNEINITEKIFYEYSSGEKYEPR